MRGAWFLVALLALAGCSGSPDAQEPTGTEAPLAEGRGAIQGLLVDDRFRPLELTDEPREDFQREGFILVEETGARVLSDAEGVFFVRDLLPGTYTLQATVAGHETVAVRVPVEAGAFAEANIVAQRTATGADEHVVVRDDTVLVTCNAQFVNGHFSPGRQCFGDLSNDGSNDDVIMNTDDANATWLVTEFAFTEAQSWDIWFTDKEDEVQITLYDRIHVDATEYIRFLHPHHDDPLGEGADMEPPAVDISQLRIVMNPLQPGSDETYALLGFEASAGMTFQTKVRVVNSVFFGEPLFDLDSYCVLCEG